MAQNEGSEGFLGTVRNYIPGLSPSHGDVQTSSGSQQGILSYIPGFGGSTADNNTANTNEGKVQTENHGRTEAGEVTSPNKDRTQGERNARNVEEQRDGGNHHYGESGSNAAKQSGDGSSPPVNAYDSSYQGAGIGHKYSTGRSHPQDDSSNQNDQNRYQQQQHSFGEGNRGTDQTHASPKSAASRGDQSSPRNEYRSGNEDSLAHAKGQNQGSGGYTGQQQQRPDDGVRGAPIEGEGVKGYAVSAPVGSGDTNLISPSGEPSGQVSGAHMQYNPEDTDTRDHTGRGTVGRTKGEGDSSFANVKRNIPWGTEHVVTKSSQSHIEHTSTTQL